MIEMPGRIGFKKSHRMVSGKTFLEPTAWRKSQAWLAGVSVVWSRIFPKGCRSTFVSN
ncbi:hypothetical protein [Nostoc sp. CHAB 5715]|uniref:hypothetical protein n=1 Tax=Nostoc sp. CHAB 5715 TaxID=2780400 RepID=UPI001E38B780|nr:hypothetical protein [Nostoc sp. CHAB 5715]MCC5623877.1 hypothetical protein [Nostoc sp. CHAB 5715]